MMRKSNGASAAANGALLLAGLIFTSTGVVELLARGPEDAIIWLALGQMFISLMSFSWPALSISQKILFTPVLLLPTGILVYAIYMSFVG